MLLLGLAAVATQIQVGIENASNAIHPDGWRPGVQRRAALADRCPSHPGGGAFEVASGTGPSPEEVHPLEVRLRDAFFYRFDFVEVMSAVASSAARECRGTPPRSVFSLSGLRGRPRRWRLSTLLARLSDRCSGNIVWSRELEGPKKSSEPGGG